MTPGITIESYKTVKGESLPGVSAFGGFFMGLSGDDLALSLLRTAGDSIPPGPNVVDIAVRPFLGVFSDKKSRNEKELEAASQVQGFLYQFKVLAL